ncbi:MAG: CDP-alcohol phosphatidyltransferase family protein [Sphingobacteriales bacterium JAD_PAG50586_3]|nr:MAG: CDP-alcohol phosphatidyltransferase family protein [Sphingobacteriales bacterium JAD_PAG50586_3]
MIKRQIPNIVTSLNLLCGFLGIISLSWGFDFESGLPNNNIAIYLMFAAAFFDFVDGFVARALKVDSDLGKQLDSLADVVTFGVLPGLLMLIAISESWECYFHKAYALQTLLSNPDIFLFVLKEAPKNVLLTLLFSLPALLVPILSAFRLAKFNIDTQGKATRLLACQHQLMVCFWQRFIM